VKSGGDFEHILGGDAPDIWRSNRPAKGGDTGALFARIIERAANVNAATRVDRRESKVESPQDRRKSLVEGRTSRAGGPASKVSPRKRKRSDQ